MKLFLIFWAFCANAYAIESSQWGPLYTVKGILHIPYGNSEVRDEFQAWVDEKQERSRIDYNSGTVKTYQFRHNSTFGELIKIYPTQDWKDGETKYECLKNLTQSVVFQPAIPNLVEFKTNVKEQLMGVDCIKYTNVSKGVDHTELSVEKTLWVRQDSAAKIIPIRYEKKKYNTTSSILKEHFYIEYYSYSKQIDDDSVFKVDAGHEKDCRHFVDVDALFMDLMFNYIPEIPPSHKSFMQKYNVKYGSFNEHVYRQKIFAENVRFIESTNRKNLGYTLAVNHLADRTPDELRMLRGEKPSSINSDDFEDSKNFVPKGNIKLPASFDWRDKGAVTTVKNQFKCGSCWAFAAVGTVEGAWFKENGTLVSLSEQALIDCSGDFWTEGCRGGNKLLAMLWISSNGGIPTASSYNEYEELEDVCRMKNVKKVAPITTVYSFRGKNVNTTKEALLTYGPVAVSIAASSDEFRFYDRGIFYGPQSAQGNYSLNHDVLVVGWGVDEERKEEYWIVKNSWGVFWGNDGYIFISMKDNSLGILDRPVFASFEKSEEP